MGQVWPVAEAVFKRSDCRLGQHAWRITSGLPEEVKILKSFILTDGCCNWNKIHKLPVFTYRLQLIVFIYTGNKTRLFRRLPRTVLAGHTQAPCLLPEPQESQKRQICRIIPLRTLLWKNGGGRPHRSYSGYEGRVRKSAREPAHIRRRTLAQSFLKSRKM